jgi:uncharacterized membrane protein
VLVVLGVVVLGFGVLFLAVSASPSTFGLRSPFGFPYDGGLLGIFLVLWGSVMLVRVAVGSARRARWDGGPPAGRRFDPAVVAARQRYARGEISREQFLQIVQDLRRPPPGPLP